MKTYKITRKTAIKNVWPVFIYIILFTAFPFYMVNQYGNDDIYIFIGISAVGLLIFGGPVLIVHLDYYLRNKHDVLKYHPNEGRFEVVTPTEQFSFFLDEISFVDRYLSIPLAEDRSQWLPWDGYNFWLLRFNSGKTYIITSLLVPNLHLPVPEDRIKNHKVFFKLTKDILK